MIAAKVLLRIAFEPDEPNAVVDIAAAAAAGGIVEYCY